MKLVRAEKQNKKSPFTIFIGEKLLSVIADGKKKEIQSSRSIRVYTVVDDVEVLEIEESLLTPMEIDGKVLDNMFWL